MRSVVATADGVKVVDVSEPILAVGEALVEMTVAGVCGSDTHAAAGEHPFVPLPYRPGHEVVGVVRVVSDDVTSVAVGDRVTVEPTLPCWECKMCRTGRSNICENLRFFGCGYAQGGMSDRFTIPADRLHILPKGMSDLQAALIEPLSTPVHAVRQAGGVKDKAVVILGSGTIGLLMLKAVQHDGARRVVMTDPREDKRQRASRLGADAVIDSLRGDAVEAIRAELGESADVVFDCVSVQSTVDQAVELAFKGGIVVTVGVPVKSVTVPLPLMQDLQVRLQGSATYMPEDYATAIEIIASGLVDPADFITAVYPLDEVAAAFAASASGEQVKVLVSASPASGRPPLELDAAHLAEIETVPIPAYERSAVKAGIAHFGVGNFMRVENAVYLDRYFHETGDLDWGIVGIGVSDNDAARAKARTFAEQDCLFTVTEYDTTGAPSSRVIGSLIDYLHAPQQPDDVLSLLTSPTLRIVTLTITEGGYFTNPTSGAFDPNRPEVTAEFLDDVPKTVFGFIVRALKRRREAGIPPFTVASCDNRPQNGAVTKAVVVGFAERLDPELAQWIADAVAFPSSMVDRVAPTVSEERRAELNELTGVDDALAVPTESYLQWVVEDRFPAGRPELERVGVQFVDDVAPYVTAKLRVLNAPHVLLSYPALLAGYRYVHDAIADPELSALCDRYMTADAIPVLTGAPIDLDLRDYARSILSRWKNPAIGDSLLRIATDGASKIPTFHAATARRLTEEGRDVVRELLLLACYRRYLLGADDKGGRFTVTEPMLSDADRSALTDGDATAVLGIEPFRPLRLVGDPRAADLIRQIDEKLATDGAIAAIRQYGVR